MGMSARTYGITARTCPPDTPAAAPLSSLLRYMTTLMPESGRFACSICERISAAHASFEGARFAKQ